MGTGTASRDRSTGTGTRPWVGVGVWVYKSAMGAGMGITVIDAVRRLQVLRHGLDTGPGMAMRPCRVYRCRSEFGTTGPKIKI